MLPTGEHDVVIVLADGLSPQAAVHAHGVPMLPALTARLDAGGSRRS